MLLLLVSKRSSCSLHCSTVIELVSFRIASIQLDTDSGGSRPSDKGEGGGLLDPEIRGEGAGLKKRFFFRPFGPLFGLKISGGRPSRGSATDD